MIVSLMSVVFCSNPDHYSTSSKCSGVDINTARLFYHRLIQPDYPHISQIVSHLFLCFQREWNQRSVIFRRFMLNVLFFSELLLSVPIIPVVTSACFILIQIAASLEKNLLPRLSSSPPDIEALRLYLTLPECPLLSNPNNYTTLTIPFAKAIVSLKDTPIKVLGTSHPLQEDICFVGLRHGSCKTLNNIFLVQNQQSNAFLLLSLYKNKWKWNSMNSINMFCIMRWLCTESLYLKWCFF